MAAYRIYFNPGGLGYLLDVQAELHNHFNTRMVVPLLPIDRAPTPAKILNPLFEIDTEQYVMVTQFMAAIPVKALKNTVFSAEDRRGDIVAAIDLLLQGF